jgi:NhaP-type Na+/H+ or K+/H+ antiporter
MNPLDIVPWTILMIGVLIVVLWLSQLAARRRPPIPTFLLGVQVGLLLWMLWLLLYGHDLRYDPSGFTRKDAVAVPLIYRDGGLFLSPREAEPLSRADLN